MLLLVLVLSRLAWSSWVRDKKVVDLIVGNELLRWLRSFQDHCGELPSYIAGFFSTSLHDGIVPALRTTRTTKVGTNGLDLSALSVVKRAATGNYGVKWQ